MNRDHQQLIDDVKDVVKQNFAKLLAHSSPDRCVFARQELGQIDVNLGVMSRADAKDILLELEEGVVHTYVATLDDPVPHGALRVVYLQSDKGKLGGNRGSFLVAIEAKGGDS